ncbi:hypothetical protein BOTBODRAFT_602745 [Botryobasidium botryosum FD-172 SS1]|uniref:Uncharacterized protein n=1 Tax=Botryobasidium botryosum (strain FD-172 SS1) TaxID=930990 RepID=A0A067MP31_BOTB1|nr:hypothetical protein BOTBODRAFT_602745 [Botryobasidium botryosum FD-172 SS1]
MPAGRGWYRSSGNRNTNGNQRLQSVLRIAIKGDCVMGTHVSRLMSWLLLRTPSSRRKPYVGKRERSSAPFAIPVNGPAHGYPYPSMQFAYIHYLNCSVPSRKWKTLHYAEGVSPFLSAAASRFRKLSARQWFPEGGASCVFLLCSVVVIELHAQRCVTKRFNNFQPWREVQTEACSQCC